MFKQQKETSIDKNQSHTTKMDKGNIKKIDDTIPEPSFDNHDEALKWANNRLSSYAEIRSVALILKTFPQNNQVFDTLKFSLIKRDNVLLKTTRIF